MAPLTGVTDGGGSSGVARMTVLFSLKSIGSSLSVESHDAVAISTTSNIGSTVIEFCQCVPAWDVRSFIVGTISVTEPTCAP